MVESYLIYSISTVLAVGFAFIAQKLSYINKSGVMKPNKFFWTLSMGIPILLMGLRGISVGVDDRNYLRNYNVANNMTIQEYYSTYTTEPGFYLMYRLVNWIFNDFQWLIIITSIITVYLFYKAFEYEISRISLAYMVFIFILTSYFYYYGIIRLGISTAIIAFSYRYIIETNKKKFIVSVIIATLFHYSSIFALVLLFINLNKVNGFLKKNFMKIILIIPLSFLMVRYLLFPLIGSSRYSGYIDNNVVFNTGFLTSIPLFILFSIYYKSINNSESNLKFYYFIYLIKVITEIFTPLIGIGRMVWYLNLSICFLIPGVIKQEKTPIGKYTLQIIFIIYSIYYSYNAYFGISWRGQFMLPYKFFFEN